MADDQLHVGFTADASGVTSASGQASAAIKQIADAVGAAQKAMTQLQSAITAAFAKPDASGAQAAADQASAAAASGAQAVVTSATSAAQQQIALQQAVVAAVQADEALKTALAAAGLDQRGKASKSAAQQMEQDWDHAITSTTQRFADGLLKMGQGTESFQKVINQTASALETSVVNSVARMVSTWLIGESQKLFSTKAAVQAQTSTEAAGAAQSRLISFETAQKQALNNAVSAASGAYNAMAGIPVIGPLLGAAAAAAAFTAVEAYGALASAAGGYDIPAGVNPLVQAHAQEMILPARIANPMRDMLADYSGGGAGSAASGADGAGGGDTHHWHISAMDARSFETYLRRNSDTLAGVLNDKVRAGAKISGR